MDKYVLLVAALAAAGFTGHELDAEGALTLQPEELEAIENALAANNSEELQNQLTEANNNMETANGTIQERDNTITELNQTIENLKGSAGDSTQQVHDNGHTAENVDELDKDAIELYNKVRG